MVVECGMQGGLGVGVSQNIERWRKRRALTQEELSNLAGLSQNTIWRIESDGREPRPGTLRRIAEALKVPVEDLTAPSEDGKEGT
mgnify:CR=1 FL=1